ncbi:uncharacterized protein LOC142907901, partial [Petromyzon marinus]|uniref:uncharacterized protein LOC142907901 n=1 Tax=Petromyzon marinus TaxID=7757 RepID=UPI003F712684
MDYERTLSGGERGGAGAQTDMLGVDLVLTRASGVLVPVVLDVNERRCLSTCGAFEAMNPSSRGEAAGPWLQTMLHRSQAYLLAGADVLVIGAGGTSKKFVWELAEQLGIRIHLVDSNPAHFAASMVTSFTFYDYVDHRRDDVHAKAIAAAVAARGLRPRGCLAFWEECIVLAAGVAHLLGLRGNSVEAMRRVKQKSITHQHLSTSPSTSSFTVRSLPLSSWRQADEASRSLTHSLTISLSHYLTISLSHYLTISLSHHLTISLSHYLTISPSHHLTISPSHHLTISLTHHLTISLSHHLTISLSHYLTISPSHHLTISLSHHLTISPSHSLTISLSHYLTISLTHHLTVSPSHYLTISLSHHLTISPSHYLTISLSHYLTISPSHYLTISLSHYLTISLSHHLTISPSHHLTISLSHHLTISLSHHLTISLTHCLPLSLTHSLTISLSHYLTISLTISLTHRLTISPSHY